MTISEVRPNHTQTPLRKLYQTLLAADLLVTNPDQRYKAELLAILSLSFTVILGIGLLITLQLTGWSAIVVAGLSFMVVALLTYFISRSRIYTLAPGLFVIGFAVMAYLVSFLGPYPAVFLILTLSITFLLSNLFELKWMVIFITINLFLMLLLSTIFLTALPAQEVLNLRAGLFSIGLFAAFFAWYRDNLERLRLSDVARAQENLQQANLDLLQAQHEVNSRLGELRVAAEVGRSVSQVRQLDLMLKDAAEIIRSKFDLYYAQVYLTNTAQNALVLQAGTGTVGAELIGRNHRLPLDISSVNGRAAIEKRPVVISDTAASATFRPNPLLPNTRSEMAVPLMTGERVVGVLDMQSEKAGALSEETLSAFEALAGQLAIAIQNASLLAETEQARAELEKQARFQTRQNWQEYQDALHRPEQTGFVFEKNQITALEALPASPSEQILSAQIAMTGENLGVLTVELPPERQTPQIRALLNIVARQVAQQLESLRLLDSAERYRAEAEAASRRITREGWKNYTEEAQQNLRFVYDLKEVRPPAADENQAEGVSTRLPLKVRDETIGSLVIQGLDEADKESLELASAVADRLGAHIEGLRQFDQTQIALTQSEKLFDASRRLAQATDLQDLVKAAVETLKVPVVNRAILGAFSYDAAGELESMTDIANWWNGSGHEVAAVGTSYSAKTLKLLSAFLSATPVFFNDTFHDERMGEGGMQVAKALNIRAGAVLPLFQGNRQLGILMLQAEEPHNFSQNETRLFSALAPQIATVLENRRQFERAQKQADREALLNAISQKIQSATSVEAVLQIAARELGHALGAPRAIAQLSLKK